MIPTNVGGKPRKNPAGPSCAIIFFAISTGWPFAFDNRLLEDCNCVLITSNGFVIVDAMVPATPPDKNLIENYELNLICSQKSKENTKTEKR